MRLKSLVGFPINYLRRRNDYNVLAKSKYFDLAWYLQQNPDVEAGGVDPVVHYLRHGASEGRNPGPEFDAVWYRRQYPDVEQSGIDPLVHYLTAGVHEGRAVRSTVEALRTLGLFDADWFRSRYKQTQQSGSNINPLAFYLAHGVDPDFIPSPLFDPAQYLRWHPHLRALDENPLKHFLALGKEEGSEAESINHEPIINRWGPVTALKYRHQTSRQPSIAVSVHVFYVDIFEELAGYLENIPYPFSLLITTPDVLSREQIRSIVQAKLPRATPIIRICQNRGRNFGPMLVEFAELIRNHELLLHLHTKKSLFSGAEQHSWRRHLYRSLTISPFLINGFIERFNLDPKLGVIFPATYPDLPYWAHHWLSNRNLVEPFFSRLGLRLRDTSDYLTFPVGSMFWARTAALGPLLKADWQYEEFPPEAGQNDGTLAHVIERSIVKIAQASRFTFAEFDYDAGSLRENWSRRNLGPYFARTYSDLANAIETAATVSFDIFDTLITRRSSTPDALLRYVGHQLAVVYPEHSDFFDVRKGAEIAARQRKNNAGEVDLTEIYAEVVHSFGWSVQAADAAHALELETEERAAVPRRALTEAVKLAHDSGKRVVAVSDTYLSRPFIDKLLSKAGVGSLFDEIYVSSERGVRKDRGDMWDFIVRSEAISDTGALLHIGDNEHTDAQLAGDRHLGVFHIMRPSALLAVRDLEFTEQEDWRAQVLLGPLTARFGNSPFVNGQQARPFVIEQPADLGYMIFGPLLFAFTSWMLGHPAFQYLDRVYFLSREGHFLQKAYNLISELAPGTKLPPSSYFYCSRRAVLAPTQAIEFNPEQILAGFGFHGSIAELLRVRLGFDPLSHLNLDAVKVELPRDNDYVRHILLILKKDLVAHCRPELQVSRRYCEQSAMASAGTVGLVDVGYGASIQKLLQGIAGKPLVGFYMGTTPAAAQVEKQGGFAFGFLAERENGHEARSVVFRNRPYLEALLSAPHGQVLRFRELSGQIVPEFRAGGHAQQRFSTLSDIYAGAEEYIRDLFESFGPAVLTLDQHCADRFEAPFKAWMDGRISVEARIVEALSVEDDYCGNGEMPVRKALAPAVPFHG